jgi:hypothetical protein
MIWKTHDGNYLVQGVSEPVKDLLGQPIQRADGTPIAAGAAFALLTPTGELATRYSTPLAYSLDDEWGICNIHCVIANRLYSFHWTEYTWRERRVLLSEQVVLSGLATVTPAAVPDTLRQLIASLIRLCAFGIACYWSTSILDKGLS